MITPVFSAAEKVRRWESRQDLPLSIGVWVFIVLFPMIRMWVTGPVN